MKTQSPQKQKIRIDDIGLFLKTIEIDYKPKDNQERADLISEHFNVLCTLEDVEEYEMMQEHYEESLEDWELDGRRDNFFRSISERNPFY